MRQFHWVWLAVAGLLLTGTVYALQQGTRFPGERQATTSLLLDPDEGDEVILSYNTLQYGAQFAHNLITADDATREQFAQFVPQRLHASFVNDVALTVGDHRLAAGKYGLTFTADGAGGLAIRFLANKKTVAELPLKMVEGGEEFKFLGFNLRSAGTDHIILTMDYGSLKGHLNLDIAPEEEDDG